MHNHLFQEHFLRTFPNEGPGPVNLSLIRKQSLPEEMLHAREVLKEMMREAREQEASLCEFHNALCFLLPSLLLPVFLSALSSFQTPKQKFHPKQPRKPMSNPTIHTLNCRLSCFPRQPHPLSFTLEVIVFTPLSLRRALPSLWAFPFQNICPRQ